MEAVASAERALGGNLPPTYREFVSQLGAGGFGAFEIYGVVDDQFEGSSIPNGVWLGLAERREGALFGELAIVGSTGDDQYYCIDLRNEEDGPVRVYQPGVAPDQQQREQVAEDSGQFLWKVCWLNCRIAERDSEDTC